MSQRRRKKFARTSRKSSCKYVFWGVFRDFGWVLGPLEYRRLFEGGGLDNGRGGFHTAVTGTMFVRNNAVTPGPSRECDITLIVLLRDNQICATIAWQHSGGAQGAERHRTIIPGDTRMSFPPVKVPPVKTCPKIPKLHNVWEQQRRHKKSIGGNAQKNLLTRGPRKIRFYAWFLSKSCFRGDLEGAKPTLRELLW